MKETPEQYYQRQPKAKQAILLHLRQLIMQAIPGAEEHYYMKSPTFKIRGRNTLYLANMAKPHVTLGFLFGAHIKDPYNLIEGTGANLRHIKFRSLDEVDDRKITELLKLAAS